MGYFSSYTSIFDTYPRLRSLKTVTMSDTPSTPPGRVPAHVSTALLTIGKYIRGTRLTSREDQRDFLDEKVTEIVCPL